MIHAVDKITNQMKSHRPTYDQVTELCQTDPGRGMTRVGRVDRRCG